jgi:hypothetical protein
LFQYLNFIIVAKGKRKRQRRLMIFVWSIDEVDLMTVNGEGLPFAKT